MADKDKLESDKGNGDLLNYHSSDMSSDWQLRGRNLTNSSAALISDRNPMAVNKSNMLESSSCSTATIMDSLCPTMWDQLPGSQNLGFSDINIHQNASMPNALASGQLGVEPLRPTIDSGADFGWTPPNAMSRGIMFLPGAGGFLPPSLAHFPADSGFIERAARNSCFSGGNIGDIMNPFSIPEIVNPYHRGLVPMQGSLEDFSGRGLKLSRIPPQKNETNVAGSSNAEPGAVEESLLKNEKTGEEMARSVDEAKPGASDPSNETDEAEYSGRGGQEDLEGAVGDASSKGTGSKKRKRSGQDAEVDRGKGVLERSPETMTDHKELEQKRLQTPNSTFGKPGGKNAKQGPQASDSPKEEYVHVRARRGQATNSHSLAERVRREKISERMKFLQDLVPGCSKVTGKAVMLDEIINYVQSLQRQVEFLSMKLATVNPRLDFNLERLLAKDIMQPRGGASSSLVFPPVMPMGYPSLHQSQGIVQAGIQSLGNSTNALLRSMNSSSLTAMGGGQKEHSSNVSAVWEDELHNIVQMGLNSTAPLSSLDIISGLMPPRHPNTKPEP